MRPAGGEGEGAAASPQADNSETPAGGPSATDSVPIQVGSGGQVAAAQPEFQYQEGYHVMGQFGQPGGGDGQLEQSQYDTQDHQDTDLGACYSQGIIVSPAASHKGFTYRILWLTINRVE